MSQTFALPNPVKSDLKRYLLDKFGASSVIFSVEYASKNGDSYSSDIYRVIAQNTNNEGSLPKSGQRFILKSSPTVEIRRILFNTIEQFQCEQYVYSSILPVLESFQLDRLSGQNKPIFKNYPKMISSNLDRGVEYILQEDMTAEGFQNFDRPTPLNFDQCLAVFRALALYHAASFAFKDRHFDEFKKIVEPLKEIVFKTPTHDDFLIFLRKRVDKALGTLDEKDDHVKERLLEFQKVIGDSMLGCVGEKEHAVLLHGDCWISNLLYRKKNACDELDICFLDWQIARYGTPVIDLSYFIFCCTDQELRVRLPELLDEYYKTLEERVSALGSNPNLLYPYATFQAHVKKYMKFGYGMALMTLHTTSCDPKDMPDVIDILDNAKDFNRFEQISDELCEREAYKKRMADASRDAVNFGYI